MKTLTVTSASREAFWSIYALNDSQGLSSHSSCMAALLQARMESLLILSTVPTFFFFNYDNGLVMDLFESLSFPMI